MPAPAELKAARSALVGDCSLSGSEWCERYARTWDEWLGSLLAEAAGGDLTGLALLAVGGYGRRSLAPGSDVDLVLVHNGKRKIGPIADALWYPIWDTGVSLDHSVRTAKEVRSAMDSDIKVALGLLDGRLVAGDDKLASEVLARAVDMWSTRAARWLRDVDGAVRSRHQRFGDLAFLLEPDLKDARGGLRDVSQLRTLSKVVPVLSGVMEDSDLSAAGEVLTAARVELHRLTGRPANVLTLQDQDAVASALAYTDADALMAAAAEAGRAIAWASDDGWRRVESWLAGPSGRGGGGDRPLETGIVMRDGEIALAAGAEVGGDPSLALRVAAVSAELDAPIAPSTLDRIGSKAAVPAGVWPPEVLHALLRLLGAGRPAVAAIEALDQRGLWVRYLPEWEPVRNRPQRNAYHRFTVDRHLVETAAGAAALQVRVSRPDLLLLGALLHDIGKGRGGDHTEMGIEVVQSLGPRLGLLPADVDVLVAVVRYHLLLPDVATRRDLDDPATTEAVASAVGDRLVLELLSALTEADSIATGPSAWGSWKAGLVARLVERTAAVLEGRPPPDPRGADIGAEERALLATRTLQLVADGGRLSIAAPDRAGLLATVAGVLTLAGLAVRSATTMSDPATSMALLRFDVVPAFDRLPDWDRLRHDLDAGLDGRLSVGALLEEREAHYSRNRRQTAAQAPEVAVLIDNDASAESSVVEVRAPDRGPVLYRVTSALTACGLTISCALVSTLGAEAVDVFYVQTVGGKKLTDPGDQARIVDEVRGAL
ncbi:MAG TPA: [protein-PII] uridylyltransferase [Acidimicrobiales bacterium]|nr:[protein-PII] uridylyltransferase [Acidimicrobiales bacterium]